MNSPSSTSLAPKSAAYDQVAFDNLVRRELRVANPRDPEEVAKALRERYRELPRAVGIGREAQGLPFLQVADPMPLQPLVRMASDSEWKQAVDDVEADLKELTSNSLLKDVAPELAGWRTAIREALNEGNNAARFALDPRQRDKAFGVRRQLGDYARLARFVGAFTPGVNAEYRQLARSLDEAGSVILVRAGEALANAGFAGGNFLLQVPFSELQVRRDAALHALRNLVGSTQSAFGQSEWPRGLVAFQQIFENLNDAGHGDLRILFVENELTRVMDHLIERTSSGSPEGLRATGATAQIDLARLRRLIAVAQDVVDPEAPPFVAYLSALQLFVDAFTPTGGIRLLRVARPALLQYGIYGAAGISEAESRLIELTLLRSQLAEALDCLLDCDCSGDAPRIQAILDRVLYGVDRAIDLYAIGSEDFGAPEQRASAYHYVALAAEGLIDRDLDLASLTVSADPTGSEVVEDVLHAIQALLADERLEVEADFGSAEAVARRERELCLEHHLEQEWASLVRSMASGCSNATLAFADLANVTAEAMAMNSNGDDAWVQDPGAPDCELRSIDLPPDRDTLLSLVLNRRTSGGGSKSKLPKFVVKAKP